MSQLKEILEKEKERSSLEQCTRSGGFAIRLNLI